jgi:hypothetical protein
MLPEKDMTYLAEHWPGHRIEQDGAQIAVVLPDFRFPPGFQPERGDVLLLLPFGFPDTQPDMFWVDPPVALHGAAPAATEVREQHLGRTWQRFSRHLDASGWRPGTDGLQTYVALLRTRLRLEAGPAEQAA